MDIRERTYVKGYGRVTDDVVDYMSMHDVDIKEAARALGYSSYKKAMSTAEERSWDAKLLKELKADGYFEDLVSS